MKKPLTTKEQVSASLSGFNVTICKNITDPDEFIAIWYRSKKFDKTAIQIFEDNRDFFVESVTNMVAKKKICYNNDGRKQLSSLFTTSID